MSTRSSRPAPITDTHIHLYELRHQRGVLWPSPTATQLFRDVLPNEYKTLADQLGIVATGIVEANPRVDPRPAILPAPRRLTR